MVTMLHSYLDLEFKITASCQLKPSNIHQSRNLNAINRPPACCACKDRHPFMLAILNQDSKQLLTPLHSPPWQVNSRQGHLSVFVCSTTTKHKLGVAMAEIRKHCPDPARVSLLKLVDLNHLTRTHNYVSNYRGWTNVSQTIKRT